MTDFSEKVQTGDGSFTIRHPDYDEVFHSKDGARLETLALYMKASGYYDRIQRPLDSALGVLDLGLGLGYNALMTIEIWMNSEGFNDISMLSLEHTEVLVHGLVNPETNWKEGWLPEWHQWSEALKEIDARRWQLELNHPKSHRKFRWHVIVGDACHADFGEHIFDFIWQDAFSPKKNPELWSTEWFTKVRASSRPSACLVTYSVARLVKDSLKAAGWRFERLEAGGQKRQWLRAFAKADLA